MKNDLLKELNPQQQKAVSHTDGPSIILAGAGSGKTRVLTYKVIYLILVTGIDPTRILMVTFTNKAAKEMRDRMLNFSVNGEKITLKNLPTISTFHSLCAKILRVDGKHIGLSTSYTIYDSQDQLDAIKEAMGRLSISAKEYKPSSVLATISQAKNELLTPAEYLPFARGHFQETAAKIYSMYQTILKENNAVDFDDLILKVIKLFETNKEVLNKYQEKFRYILIDEYQDTNKAQYLLTKLLSDKWKNICVVGDFSQSIYSWRGADFQNLSRFEKDFQSTVTFSLSQNYRSTQKILDGASSVISNNSMHPVLKLWTENEAGENIEIYEAENEQNEADFIIKTVIAEGVNPKEVAVLYRTNAQSRTVEEAFVHHSVPYVLIGGTRFYERKEVKDILAFLRALANPNDSISLGRIEKIGKTRYKKFLAFRDSNPEVEKSDTIGILDHVVKELDYLSLYDSEDEEDRARLENIKELRSVALAFPNINEFLENVALVEQEYASKNDSKNAITLMTLHAAKGLEFPIVFIIGMEEGIFPHSRSIMDKSQLEEERRLCYVGMTRARRKLFLSYAKRRVFFGQRTQNIVSRFIHEIPEETFTSSSNINERKATDYF